MTRAKRIREAAERLVTYLTTAPEPHDDPGVTVERTRVNLGRLLLLRLAVVSLLLLIATWHFLWVGVYGPHSNLIFPSIAVAFVVSLGSALTISRVKKVRAFAATQLVLDVGFASWAIALSHTQTLVVLYALIVAGASAFLSLQGALIMAMLCGIAYTLIGLGVLGFGAPVDLSSVEIFVFHVIVVVVAFAGNYVRRRMMQLSHLADRHFRELNEMNTRQSQLLDDISDGVILTNVESVIVGINQAARSIIGLQHLPMREIIGQPLESVFQQCGVTGLESGSEGEVAEVVIRREDMDRPIRLNCTVRPMTSMYGEETGHAITFSDISHIRSMEEQLQLHERMTELLATREESHAEPSLLDESGIVGDSTLMKRMFELIQRIARSDAAVLILGETGTGKELVARAIHQNSSRAAAPFVAINCGAIPESLLESELFGHKKGSFTGAVADNIGLFRQAQHGTVFLDEVGELPLAMQTKLLRALQEKKVRPVGDTRDISIDVRIISATNRNLKDEIKTAKFREDLYYRLNVLTVAVPPLRDRREDIPLLVSHFIAQGSQEDLPLCKISPQALQLLMNHPFPGNVRELENIIERALVLGGSAILPEHLPSEVQAQSGGSAPIATSASLQEKQTLLPVDLDKELEALERHYIFQALAEAHGVKKRAAALLGLNFRSFRYRLKKYGLGEDSGGAD